jgi:MFS family permease
MTTEATTQKGSWAVLRNRLFRLLWIANIASGIGSTLHDTAAVWTMATLTASATLVTLMQTMSSLPLFLLALPAGALADLVDRRKVIIGAQFGALMATLLLVVLSWQGGLTPTRLLTITLLLGISSAFTMPTWQALLVEIVGKPDLAGAITLSSVGTNIARALGPLIAGVVLAASGPTAAFVLNAVSFLGILWVLIRWRRPPSPVGAHAEHMIGAMVTAVRFTRHSPVIRAVLVRIAGFAFFAIAPIALLPLIVRGRNLAAGDFGALMGAYGVGGIIAAFGLLPGLRRRFTSDTILLGATLVFAGMTVALAALAERVLMGFTLFAAGAAWMIAVSTLAVAAQSAFPDWVRARSSATYLIAFQAALAIGALVWGAVTARFGATAALGVAAAGLVGTAGFGRFFPVNAARTLDLTSSAHWEAHTFAFSGSKDAGPVVVELDYEIPSENAGAFRADIARLRLVRLRDGAFRWALAQNMENPRMFRESFHVGSWDEHVRQHGRATVDDRTIEEAVLRWHAGAQPPRATHYLLQNVSASPLTKGDLSS